jgi:protoporphyrinogen oxidase
VDKNSAVIGGGIMGMTVAHRLASEGHKVTLYEAGPDVGGLVSAWNIDNFVWDKFYHVILLSDMNTRNLLSELNLENRINWVETKTGFYTQGKLYSMSNTLEFLKFPPLSLIDKFRLGLTIYVASKIKNWRRLEKITVTKWLLRWSGRNTFNKIWLPLLRAKLGDNYTETSAAFIWATIQRMYAARRSGLKKEMFGYVRGGYAQIIDSFKKKLISEGVVMLPNRSVREINLGSNDKPISVFSDGIVEEYDQIIITVPCNMVASICKGLTVDEIAKLNGVQYLGVICASIVLEKSLSPYYVTNITDTWVPFTGVIEMSALVEKQNFEGHALIYLPKYLSSDDPMFLASDEEIGSLFLEGLKKMYPDLSDNQIRVVKIARARKVFALSTLRYSEKLPGVELSIPSVYLINSALITNGTLNVNETIGIADAKLREILHSQSN